MDSLAHTHTHTHTDTILPWHTHTHTQDLCPPPRRQPMGGGHSQQISSLSSVRAKPRKHPTRQQDIASSQPRQRHKHVWQCRHHIHAHGLLTCATHTSAHHASHASVCASQGKRAVPLGIIGQGMWTDYLYQSHAVSMDCRPAPGAQECNGGSEIAVPNGTTK